MGEMENEEPNLVVPRPFLLEPSEVLERSASLDLTPERALAKKSRVQRRRTTGEVNGEAIFPLPAQASHPSVHPDPLSIPHLNSTTHVLDRISNLKQAQQRLAQSPSHISSHLHQLPASGCVQDMEGVVFNQRLLKVSTHPTLGCGSYNASIIAHRRLTSLVTPLGIKTWCQSESRTRVFRG